MPEDTRTRAAAAALVLQDPNLVHYILTILLRDCTIGFREAMPLGKWKMHGLQRLKLMLINTRFYLLLCTGSTATFRVAAIEIKSYVIGATDKRLCTPRQVLDKLHCLRPAILNQSSVGNAFGVADDDNDLESTVSSSACSLVKTLKVGSLDGLLSLSGNKRVLPPTVRKMRILAVGHAGLTNRAVSGGLFRAVQLRLTPGGAAAACGGLPMSDMGGVTHLDIAAPLAVRVFRNELPGRLEFYFTPDMGQVCSGLNNSSQYQALVKTAQFVLKRPPSAHTSVDGSTASIGFKIRQDLGNIYLGMLDFHSVKTLRLRAFACLGAPVSFCRAYMGLRDAKMVFHPTPAINKLIIMDYDIVKSMQHEHSVESEYFSGLASAVNMVARSKDLTEVVYTNVRADALPIAKQALVPAWHRLMQTKHEDGTPRAPLKVFAEVHWYRISANSRVNSTGSGVSFDTGVEMMELLYDSRTGEGGGSPGNH